MDIVTADGLVAIGTGASAAPTSQELINITVIVPILVDRMLSITAIINEYK